MHWNRVGRHVQRNFSTVSQVMNDATSTFPYKEALRSIPQELRFSFTDLQRVSSEFSNGLIDMDFKTGDTLAVLLPNSAEHVVTQLAAAKAGVTLIEVDSNIRSKEELGFILQDANCRGLIYEPRIDGQHLTEMVGSLFEKEFKRIGWSHDPLQARGFPLLRYIITTGQYDVPGVHQYRHLFVNALEPYLIEQRENEITTETPFVVSYSADKNGGNPIKGQVVTQGDVLKAAERFAEDLKLTPDDSLCLTHPPKGVCAAVLACLSRNAQVVLPSATFDEAAVEKAIELENCQVVGSETTEFVRKQF